MVMHPEGLLRLFLQFKFFSVLTLLSNAPYLNLMLMSDAFNRAQNSVLT